MSLALMVAGIFLWVTEPVPVAISGLVMMVLMPVFDVLEVQRRRVERVHQQRDLLHLGVVRHHGGAADEDPHEDRVRAHALA